MNLLIWQVLLCDRKIFAGHLSEGKKFFYTCGKYSDKYAKSVSRAAAEKRYEILGSYGSLGYDAYESFKLVGGISKGHTAGEEIATAVKFYEKLMRKVRARLKNGKTPNSGSFPAILC